jgi:NAD(P)-dependent dehydrogenase (short-subunit alcohol dehydrogenase family)
MQNKVIALTGGASGIGFETCKILASRGAILSIADNRSEPLAAAAKTLQESGAKVLATVIDTRKKEQVEDWIQKTVKEFGGIDGAANLAGVIGPSMGKKTIAEFTDDDEWDLIMGVNCTGVFNCLRAELKVMKSGSSIVNAASVAGVMGSPMGAPYVASKHAVVGLTRSAAKEVGKQNIRVNAVAPGIIRTPMVDLLEEQRGPMTSDIVALGREAHPSEVGKLIAFLLSDDASYITGMVYGVDGGWSKLRRFLEFCGCPGHFLLLRWVCFFSKSETWFEKEQNVRLVCVRTLASCMRVSTSSCPPMATYSCPC